MEVVLILWCSVSGSLDFPLLSLKPAVQIHRFDYLKKKVDEFLEIAKGISTRPGCYSKGIEKSYLHLPHPSL